MKSGYCAIGVMLSSIFFLSACSGLGKREYYLVLTSMRTQGLVTHPAEDKSPELIRQKSDSAAYLEAYKIFCIEEKFYEMEHKKSGSLAGRPISFRLLNEDSVDILPSLQIANRDHIEKTIKKRVGKFFEKKYNQ